MDIKRRLFLEKLGLSSLALFLPRFSLSSTSISQKDLKYSSILNRIPNKSSRDKIDKKINYLENWDLEAEISYRKDLKVFIETILKDIKIPSHGKILEIGSYKGQNLDNLNALYGKSRVLGIDAYKYNNHPQILEADIRNIQNDTSIKSLALGWNSASDWDTSPKSRLSAFSFIHKRLVKGGIYVDEEFLLDDLMIKFLLKEFGLKKIASFKNESYVFRKIT